MKRLNQYQIIGLIIVPVSFAASFINESTWLGVPGGALAALGIALIFKWIPYKKTGIEK